MNHHIGDTNEMSETPISDSTPHNVADLGMQIRRLERQLNAAQQRIKRLEEAGNEMANAYEEICHDSYDQKQIANWRQAKEAKL